MINGAARNVNKRKCAKGVQSDSEYMDVSSYTYACVHALGKESMGAAGELLAQSAGGRDGRTEGEEGAAAKRPIKDPASWAWSFLTVGSIKTDRRH